MDCFIGLRCCGVKFRGLLHHAGRVTGDIPVIDTHIHLYDTSRADGVPWPPKDDQVLYRPVLPEHFDKVTRANGVTATVIVEASDRVPE